MFSIIIASMLTMSAIGVDAVPTYEYTQRKLDIPIRYDPAQKNSIEELHLYVSEDKSITWKKHASAGTDASVFVFEAPREGVFSFALVIVKTDGTTDPIDLEKLVPALHVRIRANCPEEKIDEAALQKEIAELRKQIRELKQQAEKLDKSGKQ